MLICSVSIHSCGFASSPSPSPALGMPRPPEPSKGIFRKKRRGSFPAICNSKCNQCEPCMPVQVSVRAMELEENEGILLCNSKTTVPSLVSTLRAARVLHQTSIAVSASKCQKVRRLIRILIEIWKIKKQIKELEAARGNGTSMMSLIIPPRDQISRVSKMLGEEIGTASNIKSRVNRQSVLGAITSAQERLKRYNKVPPNGLALFTGTIVTDDGKERKMTRAIEPFKPINASLYLCDNKFHIEALSELALGI
ncbi:hypothetical protein ACLB2K_020850 [Fragaria x ananassa]